VPSDLPLPSDRDDAPARRRDPWPTAVLGDGSLLATFSARGELEQLSWPHLDRDPNLGELRLGLRIDDTHRWLDHPALATEQRYDGDADVLVTTVTGDALPGPVTITDVVAADAPVLLRRVAGVTGHLGVWVRPELRGTDRAGGVYQDPATGTLVFHHRDRVLAVGIDHDVAVATGQRHLGHSSEEELAEGRLRHRGVSHGHVDGALLTAAPTDGATVAIALATEHDEAVARVAAALDHGIDAAVEDRRAVARDLLERVAPPLVDGDAAVLDRRSQLVFSQLLDRATGGVLAAPEQDPLFERSGGYGYVWPRDLAFVLLAHLAAGRAELATSALRWLARTQAADGLWLQRTWTDGTLAPSWGTQLDETGAVLAAYDQAWRSLGDPALDADLWPSARLGADALVATLDQRTGLPAPSMDLWEERVGVHAFTAATAHAGLLAAAAMADRHDAPELATGWRAAADRVRAGIDAHLWSDEHGRYRRSIDIAREDDAGAPTPSSYAILDHPAAPVPSVDPVDDVVDVSLLGLAYPFGVFAADEPRMAATIDAVEQQLRAPDGGVRRYTGDAYEGGNPWVLATLWLGLTRRTPGAAEPAAGLDYALHARTSTDLLPEQVDEHTGEPAWIVPLTWSHAMYVLACRPDPPGLPSTIAHR
jgi:glucoamylase